MTQRRLRRDGRLGGFLLPFSETENGPVNSGSDCVWRGHFVSSEKV